MALELGYKERLKKWTVRTTLVRAQEEKRRVIEKASW